MAKIQIKNSFITSSGNITISSSGLIFNSAFTSSRRNAVGFFGTSSYTRRALTASYALNASGGGSTLRTGSTYPITASRALTASYASGGGTMSNGRVYGMTLLFS
jgi:hypothetical protein